MVAARCASPRIDLTGYREISRMVPRSSMRFGDTSRRPVYPVPSGVDVAHNPSTYGAPSGAGQCTWTSTPRRLALPFAGVTGGNWRVAVDWNGTVPVFSAAFFSLAASPALPVLGFYVWIDPGSLMGSVQLALNPALTQSEVTIARPPLLSGTFYLQEVHLDTGMQFGASNALR